MIEPTELQDVDICCGRGKKYSNHPGNLAFQQLVQTSIEPYLLAQSKARKSIIVQTLIKILNHRSSRFVKLDSSTGMWYRIVDETQVHEKVGHAIRDMINLRYNRNRKNKNKNKRIWQKPQWQQKHDAIVTPTNLSKQSLVDMVCAGVIPIASTVNVNKTILSREGGSSDIRPMPAQRLNCTSPEDEQHSVPTTNSNYTPHLTTTGTRRGCTPFQPQRHTATYRIDESDDLFALSPRLLPLTSVASVGDCFNSNNHSRALFGRIDALLRDSEALTSYEPQRIILEDHSADLLWNTDDDCVDSVVPKDWL